jgi:hypothetical protein
LSAPKYSSSSYDAAAAKYEQLAKKYSDTDFTVNQMAAAEQARSQAKGAAESEGASAQNLALNAGYSRARAAQEGAAARANSYKNNYSNSYNNAYGAMRDNQNTSMSQMGTRRNAESNLLAGAQQKDANRYQSDSNRYGALMGGIGGIFTGASNALSDVNKKDIHAETDCEKRREEILKRLRG